MRIKTILTVSASSSFSVICSANKIGKRKWRKLRAKQTEYSRSEGRERIECVWEKASDSGETEIEDKQYPINRPEYK